MKARATWVCLAGLFTAALSFAQTASTNFPTGLIPLSDEMRQGTAPDVEWIRGVDDLKKLGRAPRALPGSCANTLYLPAVRSQLLGNCGAYAPSYYYKTYQEAREHGWVRPDPNVNPERVMSPGFTFPLTNRGQNNGAGLGTVMNVICRYGIATWKDMPESMSWWEYPADDIWEKALPYRGDRVIGFDLATTNGMQAMKQHLADGDLGVFAVPVSSNFRLYPSGDGVDNGVLYANSEVYDFHALTLIGYDDAKTYNDGTGTKTGAFLAVNSWGGWGVVEPSVGTAGFCWLSYEYMQSRRAGDSSVLAMIDRTNYVPREVAEIEIAHDVRNELQLAIAPGNGPWSTNGLEAFPHGGGPLPYYGTITVDVTDFMTNRPDVYHLHALDWNDPAAGTIQGFKVRKANGVEMVCSNVPITLINSIPEDYPDWHPSRLDVGALELEDRPVWEAPLQMPMFAWADIDRDGDGDLVVYGATGTNHPAGLYVNNGKGVFAMRGGALPLLNSVRLAWGDYNGDGYPDLAVSGRTPELAPRTYLLRNAGGENLVDSGFSLPQAETGLAWGDFDQDGDLDLATSAGKLLRNLNGTNFADTGFALLGGGTFKSVSWADLDNDGLLDLEINGKINQNLGGSFTNDALNGPTIGSFWDVPPIWHDFNGDGLMDAAAGGTIYQNMGYVYQLGYHDPAHPEWDIPDQWRLWFNPGALVFSNWSWSRVDLGDYDGDGDGDLALSGAVGSSANVRCSVFRQETNRAFADIGLLLPGFYSGAVGWCDWDGDGDLDLLAGGMDSAFEPQMAVLANRRAERGLPNLPPEAPQGFRVTQMGSNVLIQWRPAKDAETPAGQLTYETRVGRYPGRADVVSPFDPAGGPGQARLIGALNLPTNPTPYQNFYNTNGLPGLRLRNLAAGRYYWSVRTVDGGRARSPWGAEQAFTVAAASLRTGDVNGDGKVDVADLVRCRKMIAESVTPVVATADLNNDGTVNEPDAVALANLLLEIEAIGYIPVAEATIGPAGGTLSNGQFALTVPAGAFSAATKLKLSLSGDDRWFGANSPRQSWRIQGLPATMTGTLALAGPDLRVSTNVAVLLALGQWIRPHGVNDDTLEPRRTFSAVTGTVSGGRLVAQVPASLLHGAGESGGGPILAATVKSSTSNWMFDIDAGWFSDSYSLKTTHFVIHWGGQTPAYVLSLGQELEDAFAKFQTMGYPFANKRNWTTYPVQVWLEELADEGGEVHSSDNGAYLELNIQHLQDDEMRRTTVYHELFHLVQGLVNPAYSITEASNKNLLLVNEATATWMERFGSAEPANYVPGNYKENQVEVFKGLWQGAKYNAAKAGYAFSSLISYLADQHGEVTVLNIYTRIAAGEAALSALLNCVATPDYQTWHPGYYRSLVEGTIYSASPLVNISPKMSPLWPAVAQTYMATSNQAPAVSYQPQLTGLGTESWRFAFTPGAVETLTSTNVLVFTLQNPRQDLELAVVSAQNRVDAPGTIPVDYYGAKPEVIRCRVPNLKAALPLPANPNVASIRSFIAVATRSDFSELAMPRSSRIHMAVADRLDGQLHLPDFTHAQLWWNGENAEFPEFTCSAQVTAFDLTGLFYQWVSQPAPGVNDGGLALQVFQDGQVLVPMVFSGVRTGAAQKDVYDPGDANSFSRFTFDPPVAFEISKRIYGGPNLEDQPYVFEPRTFGGAETLSLDEGEDHVYYLISIRYGIIEQDFRDGVPTGTPFHFDSYTTPVSIHLERE